MRLEPARLSLGLAFAVAGLLVAGIGFARPSIDCAAARRGVPPYGDLIKIFEYDAASPLNVTVLDTVDRQNVKVESIEFTIAAGSKCPATLIVPDAKARLPAIVWLGSGDKEWESYAVEFSKSGAVSLVLSSCGTASIFDARAFYDDEVLNAVNVRRAVDILSVRVDVDRSRIAFVGHSGGAMLGADAVAVDKRFKAAVFESASEGFTYHICTSSHPFAVGIRQQLKDRLSDYISVLAPLDAIHYVGHEAPTALLFQSARLDQGVPESDAKAFFDAASEPKQLIWYDAGHEMNLPAVSKDRNEFLRRELGIQ
jgi:uncharacterized protein